MVRIGYPESENSDHSHYGANAIIRVAMPYHFGVQFSSEEYHAFGYINDFKRIDLTVSFNGNEYVYNVRNSLKAV